MSSRRDRRALGRVLSALSGVLLVAAAASGGVIVTGTPAHATTCTADSGVSVVVDFRELGGGVQTSCVASGGGQSAATIVETAGFSLGYVTRQPGFVCRVNGVPASDPCVNTPPTSAYWGLYWGNGKVANWTYSSIGAQSLKVPDGGSVAWAWQAATTGGPSLAPRVSAAAAPSATPTPAPTKSPSSTPTRSPGKGSSPKPSGTAKPTPSASPSPETEIDSGSETSTDASAEPSATPSPGTPGDMKPGMNEPGRNEPDKNEPGKDRPDKNTPGKRGGDADGPSPTDVPLEENSTQPTDDPSVTTGPGSQQPGSDAATDPDGGRVPTEVTLAILVALGLVGGAAAVIARRRRGI